MFKYINCINIVSKSAVERNGVNQGLILVNQAIGQHSYLQI